MFAKVKMDTFIIYYLYRKTVFEKNTYYSEKMSSIKSIFLQNCIEFDTSVLYPILAITVFISSY